MGRHEPIDDLATTVVGVHAATAAPEQLGSPASVILHAYAASSNDDLTWQSR